MKNSTHVEQLSAGKLLIGKKENRMRFYRWIKRIGWLGFIFFLVKGLLWLLIPYLIAKGIL